MQRVFDPMPPAAHISSIHCDNPISLQKAVLTNFVGGVSSAKLAALNQALIEALDIDGSS
jgi:hypothetical protein